MQTDALCETEFRPLPLGCIRAEGWLRDQLRIQADGLSGHLDEFWPDVMASRWFGGDADGWERAPYWLDGVVPLAFTLDDPALKEKVAGRLDYVIAHQHDDGWLGPREEHRCGTGGGNKERYDLWPQLLILKALMQYHEATGDARAVAAVERALHCIDRHVGARPLFDWAMFRWGEALLPIWWLYERTGERWLIDLAVRVHAQGFDWRAYFERWPETAPTPKGRWTYAAHVVNNAMAPKYPALWWRLTHDERAAAAAFEMVAKLDRHHGTVTGVFSGDECLAGRSPVHGTELCAVVEYMFSLEVLLAVLGAPALGDRLEKIAFNALPATFSPDMWAHQYDQQVNQVQCSRFEKDRVPWNTNGPEANLFGLEPNYGCCTANLSQGWPKFAAHLWMQGRNSLAAVAYAPCAVTAEIKGVRVVARVHTDYPFRNTIRVQLTTAKPVTFDVLFRIPAWATGARIQVADGKPIAARAGTFQTVRARWRGTTEFVLTFPMRPRLARRHNGAVAVERGPLAYSLRIGEDWRRINADKPGRELPHADWEVYPTTPWNYALDVDDDNLSECIRFAEEPVGSRPFSPDEAPVVATVRGRRLPQWRLVDNTAAETPRSPVRSRAPLTNLTLIPYGCTNLRVTEFPVLARS